MKHKGFFVKNILWLFVTQVATMTQDTGQGIWWITVFPLSPRCAMLQNDREKSCIPLQSLCALMEWLTFCKTLSSLSFMTQMVLKIATFLWTRFTQITIPSFCTFPRRTFKSKIFLWNHLFICKMHIYIVHFFKYSFCYILRYFWQQAPSKGLPYLLWNKIECWKFDV